MVHQKKPGYFRQRYRPFRNVLPVKQASSSETRQRTKGGLYSFLSKHWSWAWKTLSGHVAKKKESKMLVFLAFLLASFVFSLFERETSSYYSSRVAPRIVILEDVNSRTTFSFTKGDKKSSWTPTNRTVPDLWGTIYFSKRAARQDEKDRFFRLKGYKKLPVRLDSEISGCPFIADWQEKTYPTCNLLHEVFHQTGEPGASIEYIASGASRDAWRVLQKYDEPAKYAVLKTTAYKRGFSPVIFDNNRKDALIMGQAKASPYVLDIYAYCAFSSLVETMSHNLNQWIPAKQKTAKPIELLCVAYQIAQGVADMHLFNKNGMATAVHLDIQPQQFLYSEDTQVFKVNDFNLAKLLTSKEPSNVCPFVFDRNHRNTERAPEELIPGANLTDRTDVFSMGAIFYTLLTGEVPFKELKNTYTKGDPGKMGVALYKEIINNGVGPRLPDRILESKDPSYVAIVDAMRWCRQLEMKNRPSSQQVAQRLKTALEKADANGEAGGSRKQQQS
jgi:hypothetical protein